MIELNEDIDDKRSFSGRYNQDDSLIFINVKRYNNNNPAGACVPRLLGQKEYINLIEQ